jgi:hypothetical protein
MDSCEDVQKSSVKRRRELRTRLPLYINKERDARSFIFTSINLSESFVYRKKD